ncbi:MFS transporter [Streptomyces sp. NBRC 109706]|uniref:MFS transporter n=1 Tax=Streptomyces sp. NBRC 109706 TaxID=1550035 RepID=UPI000782D7FB|nr:MFS transporter [Streptomyces sp. NBRC 109706]
MAHILGLPVFRRYMASQTLAMLGTSSLWLAMGIWARELTGSNSAAGLVAFAYILGTLGAPLSGVLVDRLRRRRLLIAADATLAALVLLLLLVQDRGQLWLIYTVMFVYGLVGSLINAAQSALIADMIPKPRLPDANGVLSTVREALRLLAPLVGAGAYAALGPTSVVLVVAALFALAALLQCTVRHHEPKPGKRPGGEGFRHEVLGGIRHLTAVPPLRRIVVACCLALTVFGFTESVVFAVVDEGLGRPAAFVGVLMAAQGLGAVIAGLTAAATIRRIGEAPTVVAGLAVCGPGIWLTAASTAWLVLPATVLFGFGIPWITVGAVTLLQRLTPREVQGRAYAALGMLFNVPMAGSVALGAALIAVLPYRLLLLLIGAAMASAAVGLLIATRRAAANEPTADTVRTVPSLRPTPDGAAP